MPAIAPKPTGTPLSKETRKTARGAVGSSLGHAMRGTPIALPNGPGSVAAAFPSRAFPSRARIQAVPAALLAIALFAVSARAGDHEDVLDLFGSMTSALSQANAPLFLKGIDKASPDYEKLASYIPALVAQGDAASSLEFLKDEGDSQKRSVEIDWFLELRNVNPAGPLVRRREIIKCRLEKQKKKWRIVALSPVDFFAPPKYE